MLRIRQNTKRLAILIWPQSWQGLGVLDRTPFLIHNQAYGT